MKTVQVRYILFSALLLLTLVSMVGYDLQTLRDLLMPPTTEKLVEEHPSSSNGDEPPTGVASPVPEEPTEVAASPEQIDEPTSEPVATSIPAPTAAPTATSIPTGLSVSGLVYWTNVPQSSIRVELRACANFSTCPMLGEVFTDGSGMYVFNNPPITATQAFIYHPNTGKYSSTWISPPPFTIRVGAQLIPEQPTWSRI